MKFASSALSALSASALLLSGAGAIELNLDDPASIKKAAGVAAAGMRKLYTGDNPGDVPGNLPDPYYWWEAGAMFGAFIDYWYYTGDDQYNNITTQAMQHQIGQYNAFMPSNQSKSLGNDDQAFWGMAAMSAAENKLPDLPTTGDLAGPSWLALAQAVFNTQAGRWNDKTCGGGLNWQIYQFNNGYTYRNTISNGCYFNIAARLYKYTGNDTYSKEAIKTWNWESRIGLFDKDLHFYDGSDEGKNCTEINQIQWTYNLGVHLSGAAAMWNATQDEVWKTRITQMIKTMGDTFFRDDVMYEVACELNGKCNTDQRSFKAYLARWMGYTMLVAPFTKDLMWTKVRTSAAAAAKQCNAGSGSQCGLRWYNNGQNDGSTGVGEQMAAMEIIQNLLITNVSGPVTETKGGTSKSDPSAGGEAENDPIVFSEITTGDKAGAGFLTTVVLIGILAGAWWMVAN
ncbi:hypothetical protein SLS60_004986 [Paraconiothyrium brasiliense]|uniref:Mannan endo-1,6-alpha-mannosidase n=1 Tax=Paraconiothyrium brasiliense TaxID=300254 RepID=A0ABR3RLX8_9PLEO